jgi:non-heme chloroperoxidase
VPAMTTPDGAEIHYEDAGDGSPIVLLPGLSMSGWHFQRQLALAAGHRVIRIDVRGHGRSASRGADCTLAQAAADVHELIVGLDLAGVTLAGWSMSSFVLYEYLSAFGSDRLAALCSIEMTPRNNLAEDWSYPVLGNLDMAGVVMNASLVFKERAVWQTGLTQACFAEGTVLDDETLDGWVREGLRSSDYATVSYWIDLAMSDWRSFVGEIELPVLLCHGARSLACPLEAGRWLERTIPAAELIVFGHSGHAPFWEEADAFNAALAGFVAGL